MLGIPLKYFFCGNEKQNMHAHRRTHSARARTSLSNGARGEKRAPSTRACAPRSSARKTQGRGWGWRVGEWGGGDLEEGLVAVGQEVEDQLGGEGGGEEVLHGGEGRAGLGGLGAEHLRLDDVDEEAGEDEDGDGALDEEALVDLAEAVAHPAENVGPREFEDGGAVRFGPEPADPVAANLV